MVRLAGESLGELCEPRHQAVEIGAVEGRAHAGQRRPRRRLRHAARTGAIDVADHHALLRSGVTAVTSRLVLIRIGA